MSDDHYFTTAFDDQPMDESKKVLSESCSNEGINPSDFPKEVLSIETKQHVFLEFVWELFEDSGYASNIKGSNTGVYVTSTANQHNTQIHESKRYDNVCISSQIAHFYDLKGPAVTISNNTSSLLAVHLACQALLCKDCEIAIAGGIRFGTLSNSETSESLKSSVFEGEICTAVLLKSLQSALACGDYIYGTLEATALCHLSVPNPKEIENVILCALTLANTSPEHLDYLEADLCDPVGAAAIPSAFKMSNSCKALAKIPVGCIKSIVGESGIAGLIKILICLHKGKLPPEIASCAKERAYLSKLQSGSLYINTSLQDWQCHRSSSKTPKYACVHSINHCNGTDLQTIVVKEYIPQGNQSPVNITNNHKIQLLALAANSKQALLQIARNLLHYFQCSDEKSYRILKDVCFTINVGREHSTLKHRAIIYANSWEKIITSLQTFCSSIGKADNGRVFNHSGYATKASFMDTKCSNDLGIDLAASACSFLNESDVNWAEFYSDAQKVPLLSGYVFRVLSPWSAGYNLTDSNDKVTEPSIACTSQLVSNAQMQIIATQQAAVTSTAYIETIVAHTHKHVESAEVIFRLLVSWHHILTYRIELESHAQAFVLSFDNELEYNPVVETLDNVTGVEEYLTKSIPEISVLSAPLVKFRYLQAGQLTLLAVHVHRIIADEVTLNNILHDLQSIMSSSEEKIAVQSDLSYLDYLKDENIYLKSSQYYDDAAYWKEMFATLPPEVSLSILPPTESAWNSTCTYHAGHRSHTISSNATEAISKCCALLGVTDFQYALACTLLLLQRYLGSEDITIAISVTTRTDNFWNTDGHFENMILFRACIDQNLTVGEHIQAVANSWKTVQSHVRYPLSEVVQKIWSNHKMQYSSFCCVLFNFSVLATTKGAVRAHSKHAKCPLTFTIIHDRQKASYDLHVEWATELINAGIVSRLSEGIRDMLATAAVISTDRTINDINLLPESECRLLKSYSNDLNPNESGTVLQEFENNVVRHPNRFAVVCEESFQSYKQLNDTADRIAFGLQQNISQISLRKNPVVILMEKNELAIASVIGIWKAGGHFLPVVFSNWITLTEIVTQIPLAAVLTNTDSRKLQTIVDGSYLILNVQHLLDALPSDVKASGSAIENDSLAYIIRTSGSTGTPKLCKISHSSLSIVVHAWKLIYNIEDFDVKFLQWAPISFDIFIGDIVRALICYPGQLIMCPEKFQLDVSYVISLIKRHTITFIDVTPHFGVQIVNNASSNDLESIRIFILGSDVLKTHVFKTIKSKLKANQRILNCYGMSEATIESSYFEGDTVVRTRSDTVPIGKPLPGVNLHVLDSKTLLPCPVGTVGELYISGNVLASGDVKLVKLNYPKCSALKTGDAACRLPSGDIELLGRLDTMIKLRGFRISTTEIEKKIINVFDEIKEVCVAPLTNSSGVDFLCVFIVPHSDSDVQALNCTTLRDNLKHHLPYYMLPDFVHIIDKIPITSHGKVSYKLLPSLSKLQEAVVKSKNVQKATNGDTPAVATLKALFSKALGLSDISSIDGDLTFTEQGGHSLVLIKFVTLIKQETNFNVEIADIFSYPSINSLADYINGISTNKYTDDQTPTNNSVDDIAITGVGLRLPGGISSLAELWEALNKGEYLFQELSDQRKTDILKSLPDNEFQNMNGCRGAFLERIDQFDHQFFNISPGEAKYMLPEQRIFLQVATEALAEGRSIDKVKGAKIGVFVGAPEQTGYAKLNHPNEPVSVAGLMPGMIATRVAYQWDLKGPTMLIDTACSSSLVAMKCACDSIRNKECEGAIVGGANLKIIFSPLSSGVLGQNDDILFEFGQDPGAVGTLVGEGVLSLFLEPVHTALKEGKVVYGIVKGTANNCVGRGNGITAPSATSQERVIKDALSCAGLKASDISFLLAHGTGTKLGDQIELSALSSVFSNDEVQHTIPIGSTKSVFGHVDTLSGILGVFKVLVSLLTKQIPATADFNTPYQEFIDSPLCIPRETIPWALKQSLRRYAGVSSYGMTGTNCHIIIAEYQTTNAEPKNLYSISLNNKNDQEYTYPLLLNGKTLKHIHKQVSLYTSYLKFGMDLCTINTLLPSLCVTVAKRLKPISEMKIGHFQVRLVITAAKVQQLFAAFEMISSIESEDDLIELSKSEINIEVHCPDYTSAEFSSFGSQLFLQDSVISFEKLFQGHQHNIPIIPGVPIVMYHEERHWFDYNTQLPMTQTSEGLVELLQRKLSETREIVRKLPLQPPQELLKIEDIFCCTIIVNFLLSTNLDEYLKNNKEVNFETAFSISGMIPKYQKFFYVMIKELLKNELVVTSATGKCFLDSFQFQCQDVLENNLESICTLVVEKYPQWADRFRFPLYCFEYLADVLQGKMDPLSVLFPDGNLNFMYTFDRIGDPLGDIYCNVYVQVIADYIKNLIKNGEKVRILEVGGGVGQITQQLLNKLICSPDNIEYWFTDVGKAYVDQAKTVFTCYLHMMKFCTFDITKDPTMQGVIGSFDIVLTYNVIHAVPSIMYAVSNLKHCLDDKGILFIIECVRNEMWATLTWGILDGWWVFQDYHIRPHEPMMEPEVWERVLSNVGFSSVLSFPEEEHERTFIEKFLFVCSIKPLGSLPSNSRYELKGHHDDSLKSLAESENEAVNVMSIDYIYDELKKIWTKLLGVEDIQPNDNFKSLGGESLLALQMTYLIHKRIGPKLEIQDIAENSTLQALVNLIASRLNLLLQ